MSLHIVQTLETVLHKLTENIKNIGHQKKEAELRVETLKPEVLAAFKVILAEFGTPQAASEVLGTVGSLEMLKDMEAEVTTLIATVQHTASKPDLLPHVAAQIEANAKAAVSSSPIPVPGGAVPSPSVVVNGASVPANPIPAAPSSNEGSTGQADQAVNGKTAS